jgi:hypothetical protein
MCIQEGGADDSAWPVIEPQHRPGAYWHWMASAVDEENLTRELETFHTAGLGGMHIIPIYGAKGYEERYVEYLSPRWLELLAHTVSEAERSGSRAIWRVQKYSCRWTSFPGRMTSLKNSTWIGRLFKLSLLLVPMDNE